MTQLIDEQGRLPMPKQFKPGEAVEVEFDGADRLVVRRTASHKETVKLVMNPDGTSTIVGLPKFDSEDVRRIMAEFP
jgi:hypothetical protein